MKKFPRQILVCSLMLILITSACGASPIVVTVLPNEPALYPAPGVTDTATVTITTIPPTSLIPITGENMVSLQCQFCVDSEAHAVLVFPDFAFFDIDASSPVSCLTANVVNGQRILICRGTQKATFNLDICSDGATCQEFQVVLQECPLLEAGTPAATFTPFTPIFLTPLPTRDSPDGPDATQTATRVTPSRTPGAATATPTSPPPVATTRPPISTTEPPTSEPEPTSYP